MIVKAIIAELKIKLSMTKYAVHCIYILNNAEVIAK